MSIPKDFLLSVYNRCNEHLKEQSTKRDKTLTFYFVLISFYWGSYSATDKLLVGRYSLVLLNLVICLISAMTIRTLSGLRSWQIQYIDSILILNQIIAKDKFEFSDVTQSIKDFYSKKNNEYKKINIIKMFAGIENRIILVMTFISGFPVVMFIKELMHQFSINNNEIIFIFEVMFYILYILLCGYSAVKRIKNSASQVTWIIKFE